MRRRGDFGVSVCGYPTEAVKRRRARVDRVSSPTLNADISSTATHDVRQTGRRVRLAGRVVFDAPFSVLAGCRIDL
jgi:hypothetical protein